MILDDASESSEQGPLEPDTAIAVARVGDLFQLGPHRIVCGDATDPEKNVTGRRHREFAMASGEMTDAEFLLPFNGAWVASALPYLCDGEILGTFIDRRGLPWAPMARSTLPMT